MNAQTIKSRLIAAWWCLTKNNVAVIHSMSVEDQKFITLCYHPVAAYIAAQGFCENIKPLCNKISQKEYGVDITEVIQITTSEE